MSTELDCVKKTWTEKMVDRTAQIPLTCWFDRATLAALAWPSSSSMDALVWWIQITWFGFVDLHCWMWICSSSLAVALSWWWLWFGSSSESALTWCLQLGPGSGSRDGSGLSWALQLCIGGSGSSLFYNSELTLALAVAWSQTIQQKQKNDIRKNKFCTGNVRW